MRKTILCVAVFVFILFILSCKNKRPLPEPFPDKTSTATATLTFAASATRTVTAVNTATGTAVNTAVETAADTAVSTATQTQTSTEDITQTPTAVAPTFTMTSTATPTATPTSGCDYIPRLAEFGVDHGNAYYKYQAGNTITAITYATVPGVRFNYGIYDGSHSLIENGTATSSTGGGLALDYYVKGTEDISAKWLYLLLPDGIPPPASFSPGTDIFPSTITYDNDKFYVVNIVPTPTNTPPCMDMARVGPVAGCSLQKYTFKENCGTDIYYADRWPSLTAANIGWYDGANSLVGVNLNSISGSGWAPIFGNYTMTGAESTGTWHVVLFNNSTTPPSTYTTGLSTCGSSQFKVDLVTSPVAYP